MGLADLNARDAEKVLLRNRLLEVSHTLIQLCNELAIF